MENLPPAPYPSQVDSDWQDQELTGQVVNEANDTDDVGSLPDSGGRTPSDEDLDIDESRDIKTRSSKRSRKSDGQPSRVDSRSVVWTRAPPKKAHEVCDSLGLCYLCSQLNMQIGYIDDNIAVLRNLQCCKIRKLYVLNIAMCALS